MEENKGEYWCHRVVVVICRMVPVLKYTVDDNVKDHRGGDISLGDAMVCWERCSKEATFQASISSVVDVEASFFG